MKRNTMILAGLITVAMALAACAPAVSTSAGEPARQIVVTGNGVVYVVPDLAYINVGVHSTGDSVGEAMDANKAQRLLSRILWWPREWRKAIFKLPAST
jgi:uncharacterized protein YggE